METTHTTTRKATRKATRKTQPNVQLLRVAQKFEEVYLHCDNENKKMFLTIWKEVVKNKPKEREAAIKEMLRLSKTIQSDMARKSYRGYVQYTKTYQMLPDKTINLSIIEWETLKNILRLTKRITTYYMDKGGLDLIVDGVRGVYVRGMSPHRYNNLLNKKIKELIKEYPAQKESITYENIQKQVQELSDDDKEKLLMSLVEELGYQMEEMEVAA